MKNCLNRYRIDIDSKIWVILISLLESLLSQSSNYTLVCTIFKWVYFNDNILLHP